MERPDYDVDEAEYAEYVDGENAEAAKPTMVEVVGPLTVREFPARSWTPSQWGVDGTGPQQIAGHLPQRTVLVVKNTSPDKTAYLAPEKETCTTGSGFPLAAGASMTFHHTASVYAVCAAGESAILATYAEFRDGGQ